MPTETLNHYVNVIKSQGIFTIHNTVSNKTQSRVVAEWLFQSTISYFCAVLASHYLPDIEPTIFHTKRKDMSREALETLVLVKSQYNKMIGNSDSKVRLTPVLPNLVTSTDECTIFATSSQVHTKNLFYLTARPTYNKNKECNSGSQNHYKQTPTGDAHCRGVRIVINCTFTAGGLSSPLFVVVYGLTNEELPNEEMITLEIPGLTVGANQDVYSSGKGYLTFVKGKHPQDLPHSNQGEDDTNEETETESKEARIAALYRKLVYHPFVHHIRTTQYGWDPIKDPVVPDSLRAVSWMDGANGQIKEITKEERLKEEEDLKISVMKHSAARTVVEQAADAGPMFKGMKVEVKQMETPNVAVSRIYRFIEAELEKLQNGAKGRILQLASHKKSAILVTLSKLPGATAKSFTP